MIDAYFGQEVISTAIVDLQEAVDSCAIESNINVVVDMPVAEAADSLFIYADTLPVTSTIACSEAADSCLVMGNVPVVSPNSATAGRDFNVTAPPKDYVATEIARG